LGLLWKKRWEEREQEIRFLVKEVCRSETEPEERESQEQRARKKIIICWLGRRRRDKSNTKDRRSSRSGEGEQNKSSVMRFISLVTWR
jgi:hypothetical protein